MKGIPFDIGMVHFVGIGGIGMSGIAEVMHNLGYSVQGSDISENANVQRLQKMGITVKIGQCAENVENAQVLVVSTAIKADNPEVMAARERTIPVVRRAEMLAELMRLKWCVSVAGTHGKTTTTSMVAAVLEAAKVDPTVINGGIINSYGTNAVLGEGDWMVVEADESDGTFVKLPATIAVVTNMDAEHLDFYGTFEAEKEAFKQFLDRVPFYGAAILCVDHPEVQGLISHLQGRRFVTYGMSAQADVRAVNISASKGVAAFDVAVRDRATGDVHTITGFSLPMPGNHNIQNALAAIAVGLEMQVDEETLRLAFKTFGGVKRRFTKTGEVGGVTIIDDYGHHPVEIAAVLKAARESFDNRVVAVVQPHRYTRLKSLFEEFCTCFNDADTVIVTPVYEAGEQPIEGADRDSLVEGLRVHGHRQVDFIDGEGDLAAAVKRHVSAGDVVVCLGAGSISKWANDLPTALKALET
ncbi:MULTISPECIES: UDP-N-acetylmuramate--L-alanine ligase [Kordiimonas]|jgi:UDP-N-acetylmuramate--alanine ligase|uniref:UDP-N-acetylmuramate--L-alanine ligase n=1 Tax=Kordiimonas lacus TaxID=637679 RepID=A0A1G7DKC1_9PROT|nr:MULTISPECIES: UDP-N-acetylmuramate--L-alanine ligase [Kordiimonas]SDE51952.1 UDP-N-acetylmuramate--L-alanine ligase [Kordiimonas lacus]